MGYWGRPKPAGYSGARAYRSSVQSIAHNTTTTLAFNAEDHDTDDYHSTSANTERITIPEDGVYRFVAQVALSGAASGVASAFIMIRRNGNDSDRLGQFFVVGGLRIQVKTGPVELEEGDYVEVRVQHVQTSGSAARDAEAGLGHTFFTVERGPS